MEMFPAGQIDESYLGSGDNGIKLQLRRVVPIRTSVVGCWGKLARAMRWTATRRAVCRRVAPKVRPVRENGADKADVSPVGKDRGVSCADLSLQSSAPL